MGTVSRHAGRIGFAAGAILALAIAATGWMPEGQRPLTAQFTVSASATGGLAASPERHALARRQLSPGGPAAHARVNLLNQTSAPVAVLVRAASLEQGLDDSVRVELSTGTGRTLRTSLGRLRSWRRLGPSLAAHHDANVTIKAWIPASAASGYEARQADVELEFLRKGAQT